jgi:hypothetical protein
MRRVSKNLSMNEDLNNFKRSLQFAQFFQNLFTYVETKISLSDKV